MARRLWSGLLEEGRWSEGRRDPRLSLAAWTAPSAPAFAEKGSGSGLGNSTFSERRWEKRPSGPSLAELLRTDYLGRSAGGIQEFRVSSSTAFDRRVLWNRSVTSQPRRMYSTTDALDGHEQQSMYLQDNEEEGLEAEEDQQARVHFSAAEQSEPLSVDLPKLENSTIDTINSVCGELERHEWGPEVVTALEAKEIALTPFLVQEIVQRMSAKDVGVTWSFFQWARTRVGRKLSVRAYVAILDVLGRAKSFELMNDAFALVLEDGYARNVWPYNNALRWCSAHAQRESAADEALMDAGLHFWSEMKRNKCKPTVVTYTRVIDLLARHGRHEEAMETFRRMLEAGCPPNIGTYNVLIRALGAAGRLDAAAALVHKLPEVGCRPNYTTYETLIESHLAAGRHETALKLFKMMRADALNVGEDLYRALRLALPEEKALDEEDRSTAGEDVADRGNVDSWLAGPSTGGTISVNNLIRVLERGEPASAEAKLDRIQPALSHRFVVQVLRRLKNPDTAMVFFDWAKKQPSFKHNDYTYCTMINTIGKTGDKELLDHVLKEMQGVGIKMNRAIYSALVTCYGRARSVDGALELFAQMKERGCQPDVVSYTSVIHLLAKHGTYEAAVQKFEEMQQAGIAPNSHTYSVMVYNLVKAGKVNEAVSLINEMPGLGCPPSAVTFATVIDHCVKKGLVTTAKDLYNRMEELGIKPLRTTLTGLEGIFRKAGMTAEAENLSQKYRSQRHWDEAYKSSTERVAKELLFKDLAKEETELQAGSL